MTVTGRAGAAGDFPERCLHEVWEGLSAQGFAVDEPLADGSCQCFFHDLGGAHCEMDLLVTGALVWEYMPLAPTSPHQTARLVAALFAAKPPAPRSPARDRGLAPTDAVGRMLSWCGLAVRQVTVGYGDGDSHAEAMVASPAEPARGHVRVSGEGGIRWECLFASPASPADGLAPPSVARAIAAALAGHATAAHGRADDNDPGEEDARHQAS